MRPIIHPGEILVEEFLRPAGLNSDLLADELKLPREVVSAIASCVRPVSADDALRLSRYFGTTAKFWLEAQMIYDLDLACRDTARVTREVHPLRA